MPLAVSVDAVPYVAHIVDAEGDLYRIARNPPADILPQVIVHLVLPVPDHESVGLPRSGAASRIYASHVPLVEYEGLDIEITVKVKKSEWCC